MSDAVAVAGALAIGLFGGVHCVAMCGGIASAVALGLPSDAGPAARMGRLATVSAGRVLGYAVAGLLAGAFGLGVAGALGTQGGAALRMLAGALLLAMALIVGGIWRIPAAFERAGLSVWRHLAPLAGSLRSGQGAVRLVLLGMLWGWLPCGLVYGALAWAATTGHPFDGVVVMVAFGAGTLPATLATGAAAARFGGMVRATRSRRAAGILLAAFAIWTVAGGGMVTRAAQTEPGCHADSGRPPSRARPARVLNPHFEEEDQR